MTSSNDKRENPRTSRVRKLIIDTAIDLLLHEGASEVTATRISKETGVARTTIYRHWPDQASLLLATIETIVDHRPTPPNSGDLTADLIEVLSSLRTRLVKRSVRIVFAALADYACRDEAFVISQRTFVEGLVTPTADVLRQAQDAGTAPSSLDCSATAHSLAGPLLYQFLVMRADIADQQIEAVVSQFLAVHGTS